MRILREKIHTQFPCKAKSVCSKEGDLSLEAGKSLDNKEEIICVTPQVLLSELRFPT